MRARGPSRITSASAANAARADATVAARLGDPISSSPSSITLRLNAGASSLRGEHVERRQQHHDRRFVVRCGTREDAELGIERPRLQGVLAHVLPFARRVAAPDDGLERIRLRPLRRDHRLTVVVNIEEERRQPGARSELGEHDRPSRLVRHEPHG